jgi:cellulose synthase (UDP-forming)
MIKQFYSALLFSQILIISLYHCLSAGNQVEQKDALSALWSFYRFNFIENGRVISHDEKGVTTSEGQSYAMLRSVWIDDHATFDSVWEWTKGNLKRNGDKLFAWKYNNGRVLDFNSATDADVDIALALILASRRYSDEKYAQQARRLLKDIWEKEILEVHGKYYVTAGNWAPRDRFSTIHVAYLAPYAYETFSEFDKDHPWLELVTSSYEILNWIYFDMKLSLPPEIIYVDKRTGSFLLSRPKYKDTPRFSYDAFPIFWRVAVDYRWYGRKEEKLRKAMISFFQEEWKNNGKKFYDTYSLDGEKGSEFEGLPLYSTVQALAVVEDSRLAEEIKSKKLDNLWKAALAGEETPYYFHNWIWFGRAFELKMVRSFTEFFDFLSPIEFRDFSSNFPWALVIAALALYFLLQFEKLKYRKLLKIIFLSVGFFICIRYLVWRITSTLNFLEPAGPFISILLWIAEVYCFTTVLTLFVQVGIDPKNRRKPASAPGFQPSVDIFIPIYSESPEILEKTVLAALNINYPNKKVHICDDSHKEEVVQLAARMGVNYIKGPKKHAKAGNLNNAFTKTDGELLVVFDTDHVPVKTFLSETVPYFCNPKVGILQTPHHFVNSDIFQRAFGKDHEIPDESAMFNHGVLGARDNWGGAYFVGSGAVFRRAAIEQIGGFKLLSITEDIHTSQHIQSHGWKSVFVNKDLLSGLSAENLSSYIVQRRRWMLGSLQIFLKDNPLLMKGLPLRHKLGYFSSLYYFFYPVPKVVFWITPLFFLIFHWHPIFSDVTILLAYLVPYMLILPLVNSSLLPKWPRMFWGEAYENLISFQMFRSMFDLFLPKNLGFKVTPKGIKSDKRIFDFRSSKATIIAALISVFAILKGIIEFNYFGIERDAYFFNIGWALYNLLLLSSSLLVAWERPQRRSEERVRKPFKCRISGDEKFFTTSTVDLSVDGFSVQMPLDQKCPRSVVVEFDESIRVEAQMVYCEKIYRKSCRCGYKFVNMNKELKDKLFLMIFAAPSTWENAHDNRPKRSITMAYHYLTGMIKCFFPQRNSRRLSYRKLVMSPVTVILDNSEVQFLLADRSEDGIGLLFYSKKKPEAQVWEIQEKGGKKAVKHIYTKKILPNVWRTGLVHIKEDQPGEKPSQQALWETGFFSDCADFSNRMM